MHPDWIGPSEGGKCKRSWKYKTVHLALRTKNIIKKCAENAWEKTSAAGPSVASKLIVIFPPNKNTKSTERNNTIHVWSGYEKKTGSLYYNYREEIKTEKHKKNERRIKKENVLDELCLSCTHTSEISRSGVKAFFHSIVHS